MANNIIQAIYIYDSHNTLIFAHTYSSRPPSPKQALSTYLSHSPPRPSLIYSAQSTPPILLFSLIHSSLLFLVPSTTETEPLFILEFLHRFIDVLEEFLSAPLLPQKVEGNYDVLAQLCGEMVDAGTVAGTEPNALRDVVNVQGAVERFLGGVGLQGSSPSLSGQSNLRAQLALSSGSANQGPALPWRRANVKHTSNELYVDIIESLSIILAPSGRPLSAFSHGNILFTAKISGVPDLLLSLSAPSGKHTLGRVLERPTFHPCVRLQRWKDSPGELSFVPPDGKFLLAGYEVDLLPEGVKMGGKGLGMPVGVEIATGLGPAGLEFEAKLSINVPSSAGSGAVSGRAGGRQPGKNQTGAGSFFNSTATPTAPTIQDLSVSILIPHTVRNILELKASRGEASFSVTEHEVEWRLSTKDVASNGTATLRCSIVGPLDSNEEIDAAAGINGINGIYIAEEEMPTSGYQNSTSTTTSTNKNETRDHRKVEQNRILMPKSASVSFSIKGWLPSGVRVDSLVVDVKRSRGLGEGVKPVKGAKYLTVSRRGVETRC